MALELKERLDMDVQDKVEREITINAPIERVWELVSEPGWWISDDAGDRSGQRRWREGDLEIIEDARYGRFPVLTVASEPPRYVSFRGAMSRPGEEPMLNEGNSTLVEFWLTEQDGGTLLRVVESGFAAIAAAAGDEKPFFTPEENSKGWEQELGILKSLAEGGAA